VTELGQENPFLRFEPHEFEFGQDLPWTLKEGERSRWSLMETRVLWGSCWKMLLPLMRRPGITDIEVRGAGRVRVVTKEGKFETSLNFDPNLPAPKGWPESQKRPTAEDLLMGLANIYQVSEKRPFWSPKTPMGDVVCTGSLEDGSRITGWAPILSTENQTVINIRRFSPVPYSFLDLIEFGTLTREAADVLRMAVQADASMIFAGAPASGTTTLLQATMAHIPFEKVPVTIEVAPELKLEHPQVTGFRVRNKANGAGTEFQDVQLSDLCDSCMRAQPDWIICGQIQDPLAASSFLNALDSGAAGACTMYASDLPTVGSKFHALLSAARPTARESSLRMAIGGAVRLVVVMERVNESRLSPGGGRVQIGRRRVKEIAEILGSNGDTIFIHPLFRTRIRQVRYEHNGFEIHFPERTLEMVGIPFFGLELKDVGSRMPDWWDEAQLEHIGKFEKVGRVALSPYLLDLSCSIPPVEGPAKDGPASGANGSIPPNGALHARLDPNLSVAEVQ